MDPGLGLRKQKKIEIKNANQHVRYTLEPLHGNSYYTRIIISDCKISNLKLRANGNVVMETDYDDLDFPNLRLRTAEVSFDVNSVSLFGHVVINIHKHSDTVAEFYSE
jgi:hypothetical protein